MSVYKTYKAINLLLDKHGKDIVSLPEVNEILSLDFKFANEFFYVAGSELQTHDTESVSDKDGFAWYIINRLEDEAYEQKILSEDLLSLEGGGNCSLSNRHYLALCFAHQYFVFEKRHQWIDYASLNPSWKEHLGDSIQHLRLALLAIGKCDMSEKNPIVRFQILNETKRLYSILLELLACDQSSDLNSGYLFQDQLENLSDEVWLILNSNMVKWISGFVSD